MEKWLLIDGFNLAYRCFFAIPELSRADGFPTNALHGWVKSIWRLQDQEKPTRSLVFFDLGGAQDRLALLPEYKAQRQEMPEALRKQVPEIKALTRALGLVGCEREGVESDDLLASQAVAAAAQGDEVLIVSSDKDFAQIVNDRIGILLPPPSANPKLGWRRLNSAGVSEKFGVPPSLISDYLALVGDSSDNIPGISGVGPKTAVKWLQQHASLEGILANTDKLEPSRFRDPVRSQSDLLRRNQKLTRLNLGYGLVCTKDEPIRLGDVLGLLEKYEMRAAADEARRRYEQTCLF
jgi:DNA polymerase-1